MKFRWWFFIIVFLFGFLIAFFWPEKKLISPATSFTPNLGEKLTVKVAPSLPLNFSGVATLDSLAPIPHYLVFNLDNGRVYAAKAVDDRLSPASFTKLLTSQVALDLGFSDQLLTATKTSVDKVPTILGLKVGEQLKLTDLLRAAIATSGNDAATTLAEGVAAQNGLGFSDFISLMNHKATLLKMTASHFANADGLDDPDQYSTLADIAKLVVNAVKNYPEILAAAASDRADIEKSSTHDRYYLPNWNGLLGIYPGVFGGKIAYTDTVGYSTIVLGQRNGVRLAALATGAQSILERDLTAAALLDAGFIAEKIKPVNLTKYPLNLRYKAWGDLARQIRAELVAGGEFHPTPEAARRDSSGVSSN